MELEDNRPSESAGYFLTAGQDGNYGDVIEGEDHVEMHGPFLVGINLFE